MDVGTIFNGISYLVIVVLMITSLVLGADKIETYSDLVDTEAEVNMVLLMSSFYSVVIVFSLFCMSLLFMTRRSGMFSNDRDYHSYFLSFNCIILTLSLMIMLPTIAASTELGSDSYIVSLLIASSVALLVSFVNICFCLHHLPKPIGGGAPTLQVEQNIRNMKKNATRSNDEFLKNI